MILVPNLQRLLSGSKHLVFLLVSTLLLGGCGIFGPASKTSNKDEDSDVVSGTPERSPSPVDTIKWKVLTEDQAPPITERATARETEFKDIYNVVLLAPLSARRLQSVSDRPSVRMIRMMEFLIGMQYAVQNCLQDVKVKLEVIDTDEDPDFIKNFMDIPAIIDADIIVGPYFTDRVEAVSQYALEHDQVVVSPWNTVTLQEANPYYIQLRPSLKSHAERIAGFVEENYASNEIMLMTKNDPRDIETLAFFQEGATTLDSLRFPQKIVYDIGSSDLTDSLVTYIQEGGYRRFIVPVWSDEPFVIAALSKLNFAKGEEEVTVFGLPQWMEMSRMDYDYFENLHVHLSSTRPVEYRSADAKALRSNFAEQYGDIPGTDTYYGMNVMKWIAQLLKTEGVDITTGLAREILDIDEEFQFVGVFGEDGESIHHYENQKVSIIRFVNYKFEEVDK
ncbi:MAG: ABC transporter substrate-binding protein [Saprospiraceae bacterium]|nr:ABC transporter substrate-binding protein [Saprospiraceae bacterium]